MKKTISIIISIAMCAMLASCGGVKNEVSDTEQPTLMDTMSLEEKVGQILFVRCVDDEQTDDLMSMATNELIKLAKIENNLDLNKFSTICTDVLSPLVTRHNKEKKPDDLLPFAKIPFLIFIEKMEIDNMNQGHAY